jgi:uncharacterized phage protein gp47/JayE
MPLDIPSRQQVASQGQSYLRDEVEELSAIARRRSFISGLTYAFWGAVQDLYRSFKRFADREPWPQTATEGFFKIGWWLDITQLGRNQPAAATGLIVITGTPGTIIPAGQEITSAGNAYTVDTAVTILAQTLAGESSFETAVLGVFTTPEPHGLATGMTVTMAGCINEALDGTFEIRVMDANTIHYDLTTPINSDRVAGNPTLTASYANAQITCTETGVVGNLDAGGELFLQTPPAGANATALATFEGLADGSDLETLDAWRERVLQALATDFGTFTPDEIKIVAKTVPGVTRVFVRTPQRIHDWENPDVVKGGVIVQTGYPIEGRVRISFLRENDADPIPSAAEVAQVRDAIHSRLVPAHTLAEDVEILAPERYELQVVFSSITPDTPGMRQSIRNNILEFLAEDASWGGLLEIEALRCAIRNAYDSETGKSLSAFQLSTPTTDIAIPVDAFPVLSAIRYGGD